MKALGKILTIIIVVLVLAFLFKNALVKLAVTGGTKAVVGLNLDIDKLNLDLSKSLIDMEGIKLHNPRGFKDPVMVDIPKVYVDVNASDALKGNIHVENLELDVREVMVVKNKDGVLNLDKLKTLSKAKEEKPKEEKPGKAPEVNIDNLHLKIGKVVFKDYSAGGEPSVQEFALNLDESHQNIKNLNAVAALIVMKVVTRTTIGQLTNIDLGGLETLMDDTLKSSTAAAGKVLEKTGKTIQETTEGLKDIIKLPFGDNK